MAWRLAKSLEVLRSQINAAYPNRSKLSDGTIGDTRHSARASDHNPLNGVVHAFDITHDPLNGVDGFSLSESLITDKRVKYVIFSGRIWKARTGKWEAYRGPNRHDKHAHVSVKAESADDERAWNLGATITVSHPILRRGDKGPLVAELQTKLHVETDQIFGRDTEHAVREFQAAHGLMVDGVVGKDTWAALEA